MSKQPVLVFGSYKKCDPERWAGITCEQSSKPGEQFLKPSQLDCVEYSDIFELR